MSTLKVEFIRIDNIQPHPNADRLEIATVKGWQCVVPKGQFIAGDAAVYFPIDSILPEKLESSLFPPESKIKLNKSRVRTIKLRGVISQGILETKAELFENGFLSHYSYCFGEDLTKELGVTKYEPPKGKVQTHGLQASKKQSNPFFHKYTDIENFKNYPNLFTDEDRVVVTEKVHGTNFRAGWVPFYPHTLWQRLKRRFGFGQKWQFVYGSHKVQLQDRWLYNGYYDKDVYSEAVSKYNLTTKIPLGFVIYGEIYGSCIQKGYTYECKAGERKLVVMDIMYGNDYLNHNQAEVLAQYWGLPFVPVLYRGYYDRKLMETLVCGNSILTPFQEIREGIVIKSEAEQKCQIGRKILKLKSDEFLLRTEDDTH